MSTEKSARQRAAEAGARGKTTEPLSHSARTRNYYVQNRLSGRRWLTDRQLRQLDRMSKRVSA